MFGLAVLALSHDLPFGTPASPGPGLLPLLCVGVLMTFAAFLLVRGHTSPPLSSIEWDDVPHALRVMVVAAAATALYIPLGFIATMGLMLFGLMFAIERAPLLPSLAISAVMTGGAYGLLAVLLKAPLPAGIFGF